MNGGPGIDKLIGGDGSDTYLVDATTGSLIVDNQGSSASTDVISWNVLPTQVSLFKIVGGAFEHALQLEAGGYQILVPGHFGSDHYAIDRVQFSDGTVWDQAQLAAQATDVLADSDGDGIADVNDLFPNNPLEWADLDGDGIGDNGDTDRDGDGISNDYEVQAGTDPDSFASTPPDFDGDGIPDSLDADADGDGINDNVIPLANAGIDQAAGAGQMVTLDGSISSDADGDVLQFQWTIVSQPVNSGVALNDSTLVTPSFMPSLAGTYLFELIVSDAVAASMPDIVAVNISSVNTKPLSYAGVDQAGEAGDVITLNGSGSSDADGDNLSYSWALTTVPVGSAAVLNVDSASLPTFTADIAGVYEAELIVNDGLIDSNVDRVIINVGSLNTRPLADAGPDQSVLTNELVTLKGIDSFDVDGDPLTWAWSLIATPNGSNVQFGDATAVSPAFTPDLEGQYVAQLVVNDLEANSNPDSVVINAVNPNTIPVADAGSDQSVSVGSLVTLDGDTSSDADGDPITFKWSLISLPVASSASLDNPLITSPAFTPDVAGDYVAQLIVNDGQANSAPDQVVISTVNIRPVADAGGNQVINIGENFQLDASASTDVDGDTLTWQWSITSQPPNSVATLSESQNESLIFVADRTGVYIFQLIVSDGALNSLPISLTLQVDPL